MRFTSALINPCQAKQVIDAAWQQTKGYLIASEGRRLRLTVREETRSTMQNARMWAMLDEVATQVVWHGRKLTAEQWKHVFSAAVKKQDVVPGINIDGQSEGFVVLGQSTSRMTIKEMAELQEIIEAFGALQGVKFKAPAEWEEGR